VTKLLVIIGMLAVGLLVWRVLRDQGNAT